NLYTNHTISSSLFYENSTLEKESTEQVPHRLGRFMTSHAEKVASSFKNPWPLQIQWVMQPPDPCASHTPFIISIVSTAIQNRERRNRIRRNWGNIDLYNFTQIRFDFFI
ncbi:unnamed protein product, partial [Meganyctiphanes norvegica]